MISQETEKRIEAIRMPYTTELAHIGLNVGLNDLAHPPGLHGTIHRRHQPGIGSCLSEFLEQRRSRSLQFLRPWQSEIPSLSEK